MCKAGSGGSIFAQCRDRIHNILGSTQCTNREMRAVITEYGGCVHKNAAKKWEAREQALQEKEAALTAVGT